jgi:putative spermidine/putrescine transport system permease protein
LSLQNYRTFLSDTFNIQVIFNTIKIAIWTTAITLVIGYPTAFAIARAQGIAQIILILSMLLSLSVGVIVKAFSWQILLRSDGIINQLLLVTGVVHEPQRFLFTEMGLVIGAVNIFLPFMVLPIFSVVRQIDPAFSSAATALGAGPIYRFFHLTLPLSLPGVIAGISFVFSFAISMYVIPTLLVGDQMQTLSTLTARSYLVFRNEALGSTSSTLLLAVAGLVVLTAGILGSRATVTNRARP